MNTSRNTSNEAAIEAMLDRRVQTRLATTPPTATLRTPTKPRSAKTKSNPKNGIPTGEPGRLMQSTADAPMLDPAWTPARGYSHAANLLALANRAEAKPSTVAPAAAHSTLRPVHPRPSCGRAARGAGGP